MTSKRRLRRLRGKLRAAIRQGLGNAATAPLDFDELAKAVRQKRPVADARETTGSILEKHGLAFPKDGKPVPPEAFHDLDHDLTGPDEADPRRSIRTAETPDDLKVLLLEAIDRPYEP
jgi:hypothetical protein